MFSSRVNSLKIITKKENSEMMKTETHKNPNPHALPPFK